MKPDGGVDDGVDPVEQVPPPMVSSPETIRFSRREFLRLCEIGALGVVVAGCAGPEETSSTAAIPATTTATTTAATTPAATPTPTGRSAAPVPAAAPVPTRSVMGPPYPKGGSSVNTTPITASGIAIAATNSAGQYTGSLRASVTAEIKTKNTQGAGGVAEAWVTIPYTQSAVGGGTATSTAGQTWKGAVVVNYTKDPASDQTADPDESGGGATSFALITAVVRDLNAGTEVTILVERFMCNATLGEYPLDERSWEYNNAPVTFVVGHNYEIDVVLTVRADVADLSEGPKVSQSGGVSSDVRIMVNSIGLVPATPPWIQTQLVAMYSPTHDTYDLYETAQKQLTGNS